MQSPEYIEYSELLQRLHRLIATGGGDSEEADAIRDKMDKPWSSLTTEQTKLLRALSSDLYGPNLSKRDTNRLAEMPRLMLEARSGVFPGAWNRFLRSLRECEGMLPAHMVSFYKSEAWSAIGDPSAGIEFLDRAARQDPSTPGFAFLALSQLWRFDETRALERVERILSDSSSSLMLRLKAAEVLYSHAESGTAVDQQKIRRAIEVFEATLSDSRHHDLPKQFRASGWVITGLAYQLLRETDNELLAYNNALADDPSNGIALSARGVCLYGRDTEAAVQDFEAAILNKVELVWPYLFLAHYALVQGNFGAAKGYAEKGLRKTQIPEIRGELLQWYGIARYELERNNAGLIEALSNAMQTSPLNQRARANLNLATQSVVARQWQWPNEDEVGAFGATHFRTEAELPAVLQEA